jgi:nucleoside 2-deoxyribosyltransferase
MDKKIGSAVANEVMRRINENGSTADLSFEAGALWGISQANEIMFNKNDKLVVYMIGSLKNEKIPYIAKEIREISEKFEVFDDWFSPGPEADDFWRNFEKVRGSTYKQALNNYAGKHIFEFDKYHIDKADIGILVMPAGKSGHMELGYLIGRNKPCFVFFEEEPERWDVMYQFVMEKGAVCFSKQELFNELKKLVA